MKIFLSKLFLRAGDIEYNSDKITNIYNKSVKKKCNLLVFPELTLTSIFCNEKYLYTNFINKTNEYFEKLIDLTKGKKTRMLIGLPYFIEKTEIDGIIKPSKLYNSMFLIADNYINGIVSKTNISKNNLFNEYKYFDKENLLNTINYEDDNFNVLLSDDIMENKNIFFLKEKNADFVLCLDSDLKNNIETKKRQLIKIAKWTHKNIIYFNNFSYDLKNNYELNGEILLYNKNGELTYSNYNINEDIIELETKIIDGEIVIKCLNENQENDLFVNILAKNYKEKTIIYEIRSENEINKKYESNIELITFNKNIKYENIKYIDYTKYIKYLELNKELKENILKYIYKKDILLYNL